MTQTIGIALGLGLLAAGCVEGDPERGTARRAAAETTPADAVGERLIRPDDVFSRDRVRSGNCVVIRPAPPAWAYRADGTLKHPSEIHRPKAGDEQILYLNFDGATITSGQESPPNNTSGILYAASAEIPRFNDVPFQRGTLNSREKVIEAIRNWVMVWYAHTNLVAVVERPPATTTYSMMMIGGVSSDFGMAQGVLGVAPGDCYGDPANTGFVFSDDHLGKSWEPDPIKFVVETLVHEAGHTFGLQHIGDDTAMMNASGNGLPELHWGATNTSEGPACDGTNHQDSLQVLIDTLGERLDNVAPWIEIYTPGQDAILPPAFQALVHGTDNVALYSVELFLDGASMAKETLPEFAFQLTSLMDGEHQLWAVGEDAHGNAFTTEPLDITVQTDCGNLGECTPGLSAVGEPCQDGGDCMTGICAASVEGLRVCARTCDDENPCPFGTHCLVLDPTDPESESYCAVGTGLAEIVEAPTGFALSGCSTGSSSAPAGGIALITLLALFAIRRRRRG